MDYEKIKTDKTQEAIDLYKKIGIEINESEDSDLLYTPIFPDYQRQNELEKDIEFHWTRLSINSSVGCIVD